jgi:hypothetical protein
MNKSDGKPGNESHNRHGEKQPVVALDLNSEDSEVADDGGAHCSESALRATIHPLDRRRSQARCLT